MPRSSEYMHNCLYFTANTLARTIGRMADAAFKGTGLSPSHAFMLMLINDQPGITQKELAEYLALAPSTLTRFADKLVYKDIIERDQKGNIVRLYPTQEGKKLAAPIATAWKQLHHDYSAILGEERGTRLTQEINEANKRLGDLA